MFYIYIKEERVNFIRIDFELIWFALSLNDFIISILCFFKFIVIMKLLELLVCVHGDDVAAARQGVARISLYQLEHVGQLGRRSDVGDEITHQSALLRIGYV